MEPLTSAINVQVDAKDKEEATKILKDLGLNMSTFINMAIKQVIKNDGIPFEITNPKPTRKLKKALKEGNVILQEIKDGKRKSYSNIEELIDALNED